MKQSPTNKEVGSVLDGLCHRIREREHRAQLSFNDFLHYASLEPALVFRNIFQRLHDMVRSYVSEGENEYPDDPESIQYVYYDCSRLFVEGTDHPFFADRLFANRFIHHTASFRQGSQQNRIYVFEGPHGCGKSTFLNNLLMKFESYSRSPEGSCYETVWRLDRKELGTVSDNDLHALLGQLRTLAEGTAVLPRRAQLMNLRSSPSKSFLEVPCPSHDNPFLLIPKAYRRDVVDRLVPDEEFKGRLLTETQYEWVFRDDPCTICVSLFQTLLDLLDSPAKTYAMIFARPYVFDRRLGQGINVFNPGDRLTKPAVQTNLMLRNHLNALLRDSNRVKYVHSRYANSNNGIYALMDVKGNNRKRFAGLHGIISEGVHKVDKIEETVNSLFLALMNPEDRPGIEEIQSFSDRITVIKIPYVLDYNTEVRIYKNIFGEQVESRFLPRVLPNFAKVIISTRLKQISDGLQEWIPDTGKYRLYCDEYLQLLKMEIYAGFIPKWLTQEDRARFTAKRRKTIIAESELEGERGFSGRDSIKIFGEFISTFAKNEKLINMGMLCSYFGEIRRDLGQALPSGFLGSLVHSYNYTVLQEVKESLYNYNEERISRDIQNYLFASNFEPGSVERCVYTGELLEITPGWFENMEQRFLGADAAESYRAAFRDEVQNRFATQVLTQEMMVEGKAVTDTSSFHSLRERYVHTLKEKALDPFRGNDTFRSAIKDYGTEPFKAYDGRTQEEVESLIRNLAARYGYSAKGAQEVCIYVIDNDLAQTYTSL